MRRSFPFASPKRNFLDINFDPTDQLLAHYGLDNDTLNFTMGLIGDLSGNGNNLTNNNFVAADGSNGQIQQCLKGDGSTKNLTLSKALVNAQQDFSWSVWVNLTNNAVQQVFIANGGGGGSSQLLEIHNAVGGTFRFLFSIDASATFVDSGSTPNTGQWYHLVAVHHDINATNGPNYLYQNGVLVGSQTGIAVATSNSLVNLFSSTSGGAKYSGFLDDVRWYNRALGPEEVNALYLMGLHGLRNVAPLPLSLFSGAGSGTNPVIMSGIYLTPSPLVIGY